MLFRPQRWLVIITKDAVARYKVIVGRSSRADGAAQRIRAEIRRSRVVTVQELKGHVNLAGCCCNSRPREFCRFKDRVYVVELNRRGVSVVRKVLVW